MKRNLDRAGRPAARWTLLTGFAAVVIAAAASCTSSATPTAGPAASAVTSHAVTTSRGTGAAPAADGRSAPAASGAVAATSADANGTATRADTAAPLTTAGAPSRTSESAAAPSPTRSTRTPDTATTTAPVAKTTAATSTRRPPPTTSVSPLGGGNIHETVPAVTPVTIQAAALTAPAQPDTGVTIQVADVRAVNTEARFPGEIAGPGLAITVQVNNSGATYIDLDPTIVDLRGADGERGIAVSGGPASPLSGRLAPGQKATGVYVFTIPQDQRNPISIHFNYAAETPTVIFAGDAQ